MTKINSSNDGRMTDLTFSWMLQTLGPEWESWQKLASEWMKTQTTALSPKQVALSRFFESYLFKYAHYACDLNLFFEGFNGHICSNEEFLNVIKKTVNQPAAISISINHPFDFIEFVIRTKFSSINEKGFTIPKVKNPFNRVQKTASRIETVRNPLPYRFIKDLRQIICPYSKVDTNSALKLESNHFKGYHFKNWLWAQKQTGQSHQSGDWFDIDYASINLEDPDCVIRKKVTYINNIPHTRFQIWSPVNAMILFTKLHLPLRTYQIRLLDSGEFDQWRFEKGDWKINPNFNDEDRKKPCSRGVFKRILDTYSGRYSTGLYINTNKSADKNKNEIDSGYTIPWQNEEVLYWLEKLRNWQEKYNPVNEPIDCTTLENKHLDQTKSLEQLKSLGKISFLFRNASAKGEDKFKPVYPKSVSRLWFKLLSELEKKVKSSYCKEDSKINIEFVKKNASGSASTTTYFPLHSLRVSLITAYTMESSLPLPVISKLLAGHTRLISTIYYNKITPSVMKDKMEEAQEQIEKNDSLSIKRFLQDCSLDQLENELAFNSFKSVESCISNKVHMGWEERVNGLCLVGGNTVKSDDIANLGGCWNGGPILNDTVDVNKRVYSSVPNGPENCIRCRWFVTGAQYLPALNAQFNHLSYMSHEAARKANQLEKDLDRLKDEQFFCEQSDKPFLKHSELQALQRRWEKLKISSDEYAKDWIACFELIGKIINIEDERKTTEKQNKLITLGTQSDVNLAIKFSETHSELLQLSLICEDAEFFPDFQDSANQSLSIEKRTRLITRMFLKSGYNPIFLEMDEKQQLYTINALLRKMASISDPNNKLEGYKKVASYIEGEEYLQSQDLLIQGLGSVKLSKSFNLPKTDKTNSYECKNRNNS